MLLHRRLIYLRRPAPLEMEVPKYYEPPHPFYCAAGLHARTTRVYDVVLRKGWLTKEKLDALLSPANMTAPRQLPT